MCKQSQKATHEGPQRGFKLLHREGPFDAGRQPQLMNRPSMFNLNVLSLPIV